MPLEIKTDPHHSWLILKTGFLVLASGYITYTFFNPSSWNFLDSVDLLFHEAGHLLFSFFGQFFYFLGGSLFQILFPLIFVIYFFLRKELYSSAIVLLWVGQSVVNVSVYVKDAIAMELPLVGGGTHDWNWLLTRLNILPSAPILGAILFWLGVSVAAGGIVLAIYAIISESKPTAQTGKTQLLV